MEYNLFSNLGTLNDVKCAQIFVYEYNNPKTILSSYELKINHTEQELIEFIDFLKNKDSASWGNAYEATIWNKDNSWYELYEHEHYNSYEWNLYCLPKIPSNLL